MWEHQVRHEIANRGPYWEITCPVHTDPFPPVKAGIDSSKSVNAWPLTFYIGQKQPTLMTATHTCNLHGTYVYSYNRVHSFVEC